MDLQCPGWGPHPEADSSGKGNAEILVGIQPFYIGVHGRIVLVFSEDFPAEFFKNRYDFIHSSFCRKCFNVFKTVCFRLFNSHAIPPDKI